MTIPIRWGIVGTSWVARQFVQGLSTIPDARVGATCSRDQGRADELAAICRAPRAYTSPAALAADPDIDVVYIATPAPVHHPGARLFLEAGKPVLCEKPLTINAREAEELIAIARRKRVFLMEALWTRFLPAITRVRTWIAEGAIGEPRMVSADFSFRTEVNPQSRLFDLAQGGGALLDTGIYPISFAAMVFGRAPEIVHAAGNLGDTGVDEQTALLCSWSGGGMALLSSAIRTNHTHEAHILGTTGRIHVPAHFHGAQEATLFRDSLPSETVKLPFSDGGFQFEAIEVQRCLRAGLIESPLMSHDDSLGAMRTMDEARRQIGLRYPGESAP